MNVMTDTNMHAITRKQEVGEKMAEKGYETTGFKMRSLCDRERD